MIFAPDLAAKISLGHKTVTRRRREDAKPCRYQVGRSYAMQLSRGGLGLERLHITSVTAEVVGHVDPSEARLEGFDTYGDFVTRWTELYGSFDPEQPVWRIAFAVEPDWPATPRTSGGSLTTGERRSS